MNGPFDTPQETVVFAGPHVQIRSYGCDVACRRTPLEKSIGWSSVLFMRAGRFVRTYRGERALIDSNHAALINRGDVHTVWHPDERGDAVTEFEVLPEVLAEIAERTDRQVRDGATRPFVHAQLAVDAHAYRLQWELWRAATQNRTMTDLEIEEAALALVAHVIGVAADRADTSRPTTRRATAHAHRDLTHAVQLVLTRARGGWPGLDELARCVHASPYHVCRVFRAQTGMTIHRYLDRLRLREALGGLAAFDVPLARLALDAGFSHQSHFCRAFRREFGCTPAAARRRCSAEALRCLRVEMSNIVQDVTRN